MDSVQWFSSGGNEQAVIPSHTTTSFSADWSRRHFQDGTGGEAADFGLQHLEPVLEGEEEEEEGGGSRALTAPAPAPTPHIRPRVSGSGFYPEVPSHLVGERYDRQQVDADKGDHPLDAALSVRDALPPPALQQGSLQQQQPREEARSDQGVASGTRPRSKQRMKS